MAYTYTYSGSSTFTRIELLKSQIRIALRRTTNISAAALDLLTDKGIQNQWISEFSVYGIDNSKLCRVELNLQVNWEEHNSNIARGIVKITIDEKWKDGTAIEIDESVNLFNKIVNTYSLDTECRVRYTNSVYNNESKRQAVQQELGLITAEAIKWAGTRQGNSMSIPELSELNVSVYATIY